MSGNVGANLPSEGPFLADGAEVTIGQSVQFLDPESVILGNTVRVKQGAHVPTVHYNELTNNGQVGNEVTPVDLPFTTFPEIPVFTPGTLDFTVPQNDELTLPGGTPESPASYGTLVAKLKSRIVLTGGIYDFEEWDVRENVDVLFQALSEVRIAGKLQVDQKSYVGPDPNVGGLGAADVRVFVTGINGNSGNVGNTPKAAQFGIQSVVIANVYAPNGTLYLRQGSTGIGAFLGKWVTIGINVELALESGF